MRNKKTFSFDEEKDAEEIIAHGFKSNTVDYSKMYIIAKYFRDKFGYGEIRLERELIKFCKSNDKNFNPIVESESIKRWVRSAMTYSLRKIESVKVSEKEIDFLKRVDNTKDRKLLFMTLILAKALKFRNTRRDKKDTLPSKNYYIHYTNLPDIIRLSGLKNITELNLASILHKYKEHLTLYNPERELIKINFIDGDMTDGIEIEMENLLGQYESIFDLEPAIICEICGKELDKPSLRYTTCSQKCSTLKANKRRAKWKKENYK